MEKKKECPSCAMEIDHTAKKCPVCSYEFPQSKPINKWVAIMLVIVFLLTLFYLI